MGGVAAVPQGKIGALSFYCPKKNALTISGWFTGQNISFVPDIFLYSNGLMTNRQFFRTHNTDHHSHGGLRNDTCCPCPLFANYRDEWHQSM